MPEKCGAPHPTVPGAFCDKNAPCWSFHDDSVLDLTWDGVPYPEKQPKPKVEKKMQDVREKTEPAKKTGPPSIVRIEPAKVGSLARARERVMADRWEGTICPCCDRHVQVYRRKIHAALGVAMVTMVREHGTDWFHLPTVVSRGSGEATILRHWGLIQEETSIREDGGRTGWWRLTEKGSLFARGLITVPKYAIIYNTELLELEGDLVSIHDALGKKFRLDELLADSISAKPIS